MSDFTAILRDATTEVVKVSTNVLADTLRTLFDYGTLPIINEQCC